MVTGTRIVVLFFAFILISAVAQANETVSLKIGYQVFSPSGDLALKEGGIGTKVDLENDLALDDSNNITAELGVNLGNFKLSVGYLPIAFEGDNIISRSIIFDGEIYTVGSRVVSSVDVDIIDVGLTWFFINIDDTPTRFQLGVELAAKVTDADVSLTESTFNESASASETLPIPTLGLRGRVAFSDFVGVVGRVGYIGYSDNRFLDADIQLEISPIPLVGVYAGYRVLDIEFDESDLFLDAEFSGFYGGAFIRF